MAEPRSRRMSVEEASRPVLPRHAKLKFDDSRKVWVILAPERVLAPDEIAVEVLQLCDGGRSVAGQAPIRLLGLPQRRFGINHFCFAGQALVLCEIGIDPRQFAHLETTQYIGFERACSGDPARCQIANITRGRDRPPCVADLAGD